MSPVFSEAPITIAHVSDVHLGNDFFLRSAYRRRWYKNTEDDVLLTKLSEALREVNPAYVIVSGDIVNKCREANFKHASERLQKVLNDAHIDIKNRVLVIPGNHDVRLFPKEDEVFNRLKEFYHFLKDFFGEDTLRARKTNFVIVDPDRKLAFYCLDSTLKVRKGGAEGEVGAAQREWLRDKHNELRKLRPDFDTFIKMAVVHHHPEPIVAGGQERFMQLLDAGELRDLFERIEVHVVLHGHKHFPHALKHSYEGSRHYMVLGAGTATCPFVEEQSGEGNSFNVLKLYPTANVLEVQRWKANNDKKYVPHFPAPLRFPLFQPSAKGYKMAEFRAMTRIQDLSGTCAVSHRRMRLRVDHEDFELNKIAFGMSSSAPTGEILDFDYDRSAIADVKYEDPADKRNKRGQLVLRNALRQGSNPVNLWFTYAMKDGMCMRRADFPKFYPTKTDPVESVDILVIHPCDLLSIAVEFPKNYAVSARPQIEDQNETLDLAPSLHTFESEAMDNRHTLTVFKPKLYYVYRIVWEVPV